MSFLISFDFETLAFWAPGICFPSSVVRWSWLVKADRMHVFPGWLGWRVHLHPGTCQMLQIEIFCVSVNQFASAQLTQATFIPTTVTLPKLVMFLEFLFNRRKLIHSLLFLVHRGYLGLRHMSMHMFCRGKRTMQIIILTESILFYLYLSLSYTLYIILLSGPHCNRL